MTSNFESAGADVLLNHIHGSAQSLPPAANSTLMRAARELHRRARILETNYEVARELSAKPVFRSSRG